MNEIIVDAHGAAEQAMGWYYYLESQLRFPFIARCAMKRATSPLELRDPVQVIAMPPEAECETEMFVSVRWGIKFLAVPLSQLRPHPETDEQTREAVHDWQYWVKMGHRFG